ncbi:potassium-transporting ATPase subunit KdpC [Xylella taiwanensis]|uniref:Potassium-transporting ATPase KdpC subunit n=1 Tax=Xylella taiwanensis TaxID=1444770 RepID=Z9JN39_9GAMM|nr:potassium-transporting ATPase subunit KdpC [Xylella taiwanensis]AXI83309.1 ATPase [Xylella taiwanensis]EWS79162.1 ATPase [Xylella taiwanensis]MCD8456379.1 potassium-transporting ATPase subunit KdpC [Xylella taiwanensis]MCD8458787.1 potassium-transporting ATPase subunit KdpC [Xylella taiwanensis]MCD8460923.1 potassium-transporting ATPase subunit KdpC [Xylella taiwanensis]
MGNDFMTSLRPAIILTILFALLLGILYPLTMTGIGQAIFPSQANGSLIHDSSGKVIGSTVVGQAFMSERYFQTRPSTAGKGYDGLASSGSNLGPTSQPLVERVKQDVKKRRSEGVVMIPADLVTASGSGLDPDLSPEAAIAQAPRIARVRGLPENQIRALVQRSIERPLLGVLGEPHVNVLALNQALDRIGGTR